jgi:hypothetical protein
MWGFLRLSAGPEDAHDLARELVGAWAVCTKPTDQGSAGRTFAHRTSCDQMTY